MTNYYWNLFKDKMSDTAITRSEFLGVILKLSIVTAASYFSVKWVLDQIDPTKKRKILFMKKVGFVFCMQLYFYHLIKPIG